MGEGEYVASRIRAGEAAGHGNTVLREQRCASRGYYPRPPCALVDFAGQEFLRYECTKRTTCGRLRGLRRAHHRARQAPTSNGAPGADGGAARAEDVRLHQQQTCAAIERRTP
jgi:hypothetical protein